MPAWPLSWNIHLFQHMGWDWNMGSSRVHWLLDWTSHHQLPNFSGLHLWLELHISSHGPPSFWLQILGLLQLHDHRSQFFLINLYINILHKGCIYTHTHNEFCFSERLWPTHLQRWNISDWPHLIGLHNNMQ